MLSLYSMLRIPSPSRSIRIGSSSIGVAQRLSTTASGLASVMISAISLRSWISKSNEHFGSDRRLCKVLRC